MRRPVAWVVAIVLLAEALGIGALNWFLGVVVHRQKMSLAGLDPDVMSTSSKAGGVIFGLYFALCALVALLIGIRDRAPAGFGRVVLISAAVVHALLGAFVWGLVGWTAFLFMIVMFALIVLLLMTYDGQDGAGQPAAGGVPGQGGAPAAETEPPVAGTRPSAPVSASADAADEPQGCTGEAAGEARDGEGAHSGARHTVPAQVTPPVPTTP